MAQRLADRVQVALARVLAERLEALCAANAAPSAPRLVTFATTGGKASFTVSGKPSLAPVGG